MKIDKLTVHNFGPFKGTQEIEFPDDNLQNVMVVFADNMRGKTTVLNALRWTLYGKAKDRQGNPAQLADLVNYEVQREGPFQAYTAMQFEHDGSVYEMRRSIDSVKYPSDFSSSVLMRKNGKVVIADVVAEEVNRILPEDIAQFYLFDGELLQEFEALVLENDARGDKIREAIEKVLGVPALINGRNDLSALLRQLQKAEASELKRNGLEKKLTEESLALNDEIGDLEKSQSDLQEHLSQEGARIAEIDRILSGTEATRQKAYDLALQRSRLHQLKEGRTAVSRESATAAAGAWKDLLQRRVEARRSTLSAEIASADKQSQAEASLLSERHRLQQVLDRHVCDTCGQPVSEETRTRVHRRLGEIEAETAQGTAVRDVTGLRLELAVLNSLTPTGAQATLRRLTQEADRREVDIADAESRIAQLQQDLRGSDVEKIAGLQSERDGHQRVIGKTQVEISLVEAKIQEKQARLKTLSSLMKQSGARSSSASAQVEVVQGLVEVFSESVDVMRETLRRKVEGLASEAFRLLTTEKTYSGLEINTSYGLTILDSTHHPIKRRAAGAEQIVAISLLSALNKTAEHAGPIVVDTPFGRLDLKHRENVLQYLPSISHQIVLLVHPGEMRPQDLECIADRVASRYTIERVTATNSRIERVTSRG